MPNTIQQGSTGPEVELAHYECRNLMLNGPEDVDGILGPVTKPGIEECQQAQGLTVDGIVGPRTWNKMLAQHLQPAALQDGSPGPLVVQWQMFLNIAEPPAKPSPAADGQFGPLTKQTVEVGLGKVAASGGGTDAPRSPALPGLITAIRRMVELRVRF